MPSSSPLKIILVCLTFLFLSTPKVFGCTIFAVYSDNGVFFGNNEDALLSDIDTLDPYIWFHQATDSAYGKCTVGYYNNPYHGATQGGMNEWGLSIDVTAVNFCEINQSSNKTLSYENYIMVFLDRCCNLRDVRFLLTYYEFIMLEHTQALIADASGDFMILGLDDFGAQVFILSNGTAMTSTNFRLTSTTEQTTNCWRYNTTQTFFQSHPNITQPDVTSLLNLTQQTQYAKTMYSNIFELSTQEIFLYYYVNFSASITLSLHEELTQPDHAYSIKDLLESENDHNIPSFSIFLIILIGFLVEFRIILHYKIKIRKNSLSD